MTDTRPHVVIVGAGFGGLRLAEKLKRAPVRVTVIDRRNFHLFQPLLYQVATGGLSPANIATPIRSLLRKQSNARVLLGTVTDIDPQAKSLTLESGDVVTFDALVCAAGSRYAYFGNDHWRPHAPGLKSVEDATLIRRRVLSAFEAAERETDPEARKAWLTFVIVGAGPTGTELAGALVEVAHRALKKDFRSIDPCEARIVVVDGGKHVLSTFDETLSIKTERELTEDMGVELKLRHMVTDITERAVTVKSEETEETHVIPTRTCIWAAGVEASPLASILAEATGAEQDRQKRIHVNPDLSVNGCPHVFAIGDMAHCKNEDGNPLPGLAPVAVQQGKYLAKLIVRRLQLIKKGQVSPLDATPFRYSDKGQMAVVGRSFGVVETKRLKFTGFFAWLGWLFVHLLLLVRFENKLLVLMQWAYNYLTFNRSARLITEVSGLPDERVVLTPEPTSSDAAVEASQVVVT